MFFVCDAVSGSELEAFLYIRGELVFPPYSPLTARDAQQQREPADIPVGFMLNLCFNTSNNPEL